MPPTPKMPGTRKGKGFTWAKTGYKNIPNSILLDLPENHVCV